MAKIEAVQYSSFKITRSSALINRLNSARHADQNKPQEYEPKKLFCSFPPVVRTEKLKQKQNTAQLTFSKWSNKLFPYRSNMKKQKQNIPRYIKNKSCITQGILSSL